MRRVRTILMWAAQGAVALLIVLSIVGAFRGDDKARALFNSPPLVVFWTALGLLLAAGLAVYPRLLRRPAGLAMHLGALLVLGGAMWGSVPAHDLRRTWFGSEKIAKGYMAIHEGTRERRVVDASLRRVVAELPFDLALRDFWIEYYDQPGRPWHLVVVAPVRDGAGHAVDEQQAEIEWEVGQTVPVPHTPASVTVLDYLPHARPAYAEGAEPGVQVTAADGQTVLLPARAGAEAHLQDPPMTVRVVRAFTCLKVRRTDEGLEPYEAEGEGVNPAVELEFIRPDGTRDPRFALALAPGHGRRSGDPDFRYVFPEPTGARADADSRVPAMHVRVSAEGREMTRWLLPGREDSYVSLDLAPVLPPPERRPEGAPAAPPDETPDAPAPSASPDPPPESSAAPEPPDEGDEAAAAPALFLVRPTGPIRDYFSDVAVLADGRPVAEAVVEVNHPLHWPERPPLWRPVEFAKWLVGSGGYHFYQADYDHEAGRYTVLQVVSDSGLLAVWAGFVLLAGGAFWRFWGEAIVSKSERGMRSAECGVRSAECGVRNAE
ncbi:MAG: cytochrome c biogenesis protein ResB [Planctomycetes bacterium]|nr:cytochrome c biogenesis protein ResB [Planctomycetota bacterium]